MRVFVTGASGFVGSAIVQQLLQAGHQVLGLVRSDKGAEAVTNLGAEPYRGDLDDLESLQKGAAQCDAVIHTAFNHDFSRYKDNCDNDYQVILAMGKALAGTNKPLVVTSGVGLLHADRLLTENDKPASSSAIPRAASEEAAIAVAEQGVNSYIVRLPIVHGPNDHGFIPIVIGITKDKGISAYIGEGNNTWSGVHRLDAAVVYRLIVEQQPAQKAFHAVAEAGIPFKQIATVIAKELQVPVTSKEGADAEAHFGWFKHFAAMGVPVSSELTRTTLGWKPVQPGMLEELVPGVYF
ncbi:3-beta hydroxysteroid dehydrogenase [Niastella yeongjuensis]|uniref:3-beta hydroxysteroid dehydrogenase n=1 Tax=Niastella yeongjuensis TaxID=354355 RepID=A0A1V9EF56_9BACT|nr:SDR family oxidoreductase [Niastella yeongjuensis]OQP44777.1 3-beta hydroxysteroid dehydrogenase [Niastella yeongjuensis]SEP42490.1 Nucleoside-diphosphate-sugar epimerase [Niastella yeongjuensis]